MAIMLTKTSAPVTLRKDTYITAHVTWPATTDYDLGAEIIYKDGSTESIAMFDAVKDGTRTPARPVSRNGTVRHNGDAVRGQGTATETITVQPDPEIDAIAFWAYSAQSNGTGSFRRYAVSMKVTDGQQTAQIDASNASDDDTVYTCAPGMVRYVDGVPQVEYLESYSSPRSENRPEFQRKGLVKKTVTLVMDGSRRNVYKK